VLTGTLPIGGAILAGGAALRFGGQPKGLASVGGRRILDRLVDSFESAFGTAPALISSLAGAGAWRPGLRVIPDLMPGTGVLGGLLTAVELIPAPVVVVAWDMPFVPPDLLRDLAGLLAAADVAVPESQSPRGLEPLCAGYGPQCAGPIRRAIAAGRREAVSFHSAVRVSRLPDAAVRRHGSPERLFFNINTPADLGHAEEL